MIKFETIYEDAVREGKAVTADVSDKQWALGDLAAKVAKHYGENRLERFAEDINFPGAACTLSRYRIVCLAFPKTGGRPRFFASAQVLQTHDDRRQIVRDNPNITQREAREIMRQWRAEQGTSDQPDETDQAEEDTAPTAAASASTPAGAKAKKAKRRTTAEQANVNESKRWIADLVVSANNMIREAEAINNCMPEQRQNLRMAVAMAPTAPERIRKACEAMFRLAEWLEKLGEEEVETAIHKGRVKTAPRPAAAAA
jgi:hypothetical protein